jgi:Xaa-Pro aminopeptidase
VPAQEYVGTTNLVTVDLSPSIDNVWGDCARTFVIENGKVVTHPKAPEFKEGLEIEKYLHNEMKNYVTPHTTFSELYAFGNKLINNLGWKNLDFLNNLGHSIEINLNNRKFIEGECNEQLGSVSCFTFEPHISKIEGVWGFKHENIYYFNELAKINEL